MELEDCKRFNKRNKEKVRSCRDYNYNSRRSSPLDTNCVYAANLPKYLSELVKGLESIQVIVKVTEKQDGFSIFAQTNKLKISQNDNIEFKIQDIDVKKKEILFLLNNTGIIWTQIYIANLGDKCNLYNGKYESIDTLKQFHRANTPPEIFRTTGDYLYDSNRRAFVRKLNKKEAQSYDNKLQVGQQYTVRDSNENIERVSTTNYNSVYNQIFIFSPFYEHRPTCSYLYSSLYL